MTERTKKRLEQIEEAVQQPDKPKQTLVIEFVGPDGVVVGTKTVTLGGGLELEGEKPEQPDGRTE